MVNEKERIVLEVVAGVVFVAILILGSIIVINSSSQKTTITGSYNTYNVYPEQTQAVLTSNVKPYIVDDKRYVGVYRDYDSVYYLDDDIRYIDGKRYYSGNRRYLRFQDSARLVKDKSILGTDLNNYEVYVFNKEFTGGYFKVVYHFTDYYGRKDSHAVTHYIPAREEKRFLFKDISPSRYKYRTWNYEIESLSKTPTRVYYNS